MSDLKYGQVFTEKDVRSILKKAKVGDADVDHLLTTTKGKFPKGEPLFIIRGQDRLGLAAVRNYRVHAYSAVGSKKKAGGSKFLGELDDAVKQFEEFRQENPDKIKDPD